MKTPIAPEPVPLETVIAEPIATERRIVPPIILKPDEVRPVKILSPRIEPRSPAPQASKTASEADISLDALYMSDKKPREIWPSL